jgi:KamA family protein
MTSVSLPEAPPFRTFQRRNLADVPGIDGLTADQRFAIDVVSRVLPFKTNSYVCEELIDWSAAPDDPLYQLTFPQEEMLAPADFATIAGLIRAEASEAEIQDAARTIQWRLNPHPSGQVELNVPRLHGEPVEGIQHKYDETVLFFPTQGQTCHAYCTYCFRWPQFVKLDGLKFATKEIDGVLAYLRAHPSVTDVIFTGGDPMIMRTEILRRYIEPLLAPEFERINIRIGTKAVAYWPHRFVDDKDAADTLRLFSEVTAAGRHLAIMGHYSHPNEMSTPVAEAALRNIVATGAVVRCQAPLIRHVNDRGDTWADMVNMQVRMGAVPYYMFVERDTGASRYFEVPLAKALEIYNSAYRQVSGLGRTFRGPVMSATPGKVLVEDVLDLAGERVFVLRFVQGRISEWANRTFLAAYDPAVAWYDELKPALGEDEFFFQRELDSIKLEGLANSVGDGPPVAVSLGGSPLN